MTGHALALYLDQQPNHVLVAIGAHLAHFEQVAALFTFLPEPGSGPTPEVRNAAAERLAERRLVHVSKHQHVA